MRICTAKWCGEDALHGSAYCAKHEPRVEAIDARAALDRRVVELLERLLRAPVFRDAEERAECRALLAEFKEAGRG